MADSHNVLDVLTLVDTLTLRASRAGVTLDACYGAVGEFRCTSVTVTTVEMVDALSAQRQFERPRAAQNDVRLHDMSVLARMLAPLASEKQQLRYIVHGSEQQYLVPEEMLEDAYSVLRYVKTGHAIALNLSAEAKAAILALEPLLQVEQELGLSENASSPAQLVSHPAWIALRKQAERCLEEMDFDLKSWEAGDSAI